VDRGLWFRVLAARYGVERGRLREGEGRGSSWRREIVKIRDGVEGPGGGWFRESVVRHVVWAMEMQLSFGLISGLVADLCARGLGVRLLWLRTNHVR
jgi:hypothetical protein